MRLGLGVFAILFYFQGVFAAGEKGSTAPTYHASIDAKVMSEFIDRGLKMSDGNPAMNVAFLYNFGPQFHLGFWGSNISNVASTEDNFWFKFLADVRVDFSNDSGMSFYLNDDHYYKSSILNGQRAGLRVNHGLWLGELEWMNNYQGTRTGSEYFNLGKLIDFKGFKVGGKLGYTIQSAQNYTNYFDLKAIAQYNMGTNSSLEAALTTISSGGQFGDRGKSGFYIAISLSY
jgi:hypothetical protein